MAAFANACSPYAGTVDADELECTGALDIVLATVFVSLDSRDFLVDKFNKTESILGNWPRDCVAEADGKFADVELEEDAGVDWLLSVLGNRDRSCKKDIRFILSQAVDSTNMNKTGIFYIFFCLLYIPSQQLWSWRDGQFT